MEEQTKRGNLISVMKPPTGRPHKIKSSEELWELFVSYCKYIDDNPWQDKSASNSIDDKGTSKGNSMRQEVRIKQRAYTLYGFCAFAGIHSKWGDFKRTNIHRKGFEECMMAIENVVCAQQVDGALIHQFDGSIVARLNGLADMQINEVKAEVFKLPKLSEEDLEELKRINGI